MSLAKTSVRKPVTVLIICILVAILGINAMRQLPLELIPSLDIPYIIVSTTYTGASPDEVEAKVTKTLESSLSSVGGLEKMTSTSKKGSSIIVMEFTIDTDLNEASSTIRDRIDMVRSYLPTDAKSPVIVKMDMSMMPVMMITLSSNERTPEELKILADDVVSPRLEQLDGVASTNVIGGRERAIKIEIPKDRLEGYGLTFSQIAQMIAAQNANASLGSITENNRDYTVEANGTFDSVEEIGNTVISYKAGADGQLRRIRLSEIGKVYDGYKDATSTFFYNGNECVGITVSKQTGKNTVATADAAVKQIEKMKSVLPEDCTINVVYNSADSINDTIKEVSNSAVQGAVLAVIVLLFFLRNSSSFVVAVSIPLSVVVTLLVMFYSGLTLNMMTLAGLALGIGMLVDNSIVILENIFSYKERGTKHAVAAILGADEMVSAITSSTLTTICVFLPLVMYESQLGMIGQVFEDLAITVIVSLLASLVLAITLVPVLSGYYITGGDVRNKKHGFIYNAIGKILDGIDFVYSHTVSWVFKHKKFFMLLMIALFVFSCVLIKPIGFTYMPDSESEYLSVSVELPQGTDLETTKKTSLMFENMISSEVKGLKMSAISVGSGTSSLSSSSGSNTATVMLKPYPLSERQEGWTSYDELKEKVEKLKSSFPEANISISESSMTSSMGGSSGIDVKIASNSMEDCRTTAKAIEKILNEKGKDVVKEVDSGIKDGLPQYSVIYDRDKMYSLGVTVAQANAEIKANIGGMTCARFSDGGEDIDVVISLPKEDKQSVFDLDNIMVSSSFGTKVPLLSFAKIVEDRGALSISRENQSRVLHVTATAVSGVALTKAQTEVRNLIEKNLPSQEGVIITYSGDYESMIKFLKIFIEIIAIAALLVFAIMASQFESFKNPFIVIFTLPMALIGIVAIYMIMGMTFNAMTAVGALILVGVVVNNGIVLVDYITLLRKRGMELSEACLSAAHSRLRPILMTTLTTILALVPMAFFPGENGAMTQHIGLTVFGGLTCSTLMTLYLIPCLYYAFNRKKARKEALDEEA